mgnify:CR=1 FL=1
MHKVRETTREYKGTEHEKDPIEGQVLPLLHQIGQRERNDKVGKGNERIGAGLQEEQEGEAGILAGNLLCHEDEQQVKYENEHHDSDARE